MGAKGLGCVMQVPALERWSNLETLVMDGCDLLNHLTLSMPRLKKLSLRHCKMLTSVSPFISYFLGRIMLAVLQEDADIPLQCTTPNLGPQERDAPRGTSYWMAPWPANDWPAFCSVAHTRHLAFSVPCKPGNRLAGSHASNAMLQGVEAHSGLHAGGSALRMAGGAVVGQGRGLAAVL